jgi:hypothetical protein
LRVCLFLISKIILLIQLCIHTFIVHISISYSQGSSLILLWISNTLFTHRIWLVSLYQWLLLYILIYTISISILVICIWQVLLVLINLRVVVLGRSSHSLVQVIVSISLAWLLALQAAYLSDKTFQISDRLCHLVVNTTDSISDHDSPMPIIKVLYDYVIILHLLWHWFLVVCHL